MNTIKIEILNGSPVYYNLLDGYSYEVKANNQGTGTDRIAIQVKDELGADVETVEIVKPDVGTSDNWDKCHDRGSDEVAKELGVSQDEIIDKEMAEAWSTAFDGAIENGSATYKEWIYFMESITFKSIATCKQNQLDSAETAAQPAIQQWLGCGDPGAPQVFKGPGGVIIECGQFASEPDAEEGITNIALAVGTNGVGCFEKFNGFKKHMCSIFQEVVITPSNTPS